jgi:hypothetical protein
LLQVDFLQFNGDAMATGRPLLVAVLGSNMLTLSTYLGGYATITGILNIQGPSLTAANAVVGATYSSITASAQPAGEVLASAPKLKQLYKSAYSTMVATSVSRRRLQQASTPLNETQLDALFDAVAQVSTWQVWGAGWEGLVVVLGHPCTSSRLGLLSPAS